MFHRIWFCVCLNFVSGGLLTYFWHFCESSPVQSTSVQWLVTPPVDFIVWHGTQTVNVDLVTSGLLVGWDSIKYSTRGREVTTYTDSADIFQPGQLHRRKLSFTLKSLAAVVSFPGWQLKVAWERGYMSWISGVHDVTHGRCYLKRPHSPYLYFMLSMNHLPCLW